MLPYVSDGLLTDVKGFVMEAVHLGEVGLLLNYS